jgi:hypothetical protein
MNQNNASVDHLNEIYQAADMGAQGCQLILNKTDDTQLYQKLQSYNTRYNQVKDEAATLITQKGELPQEASEFEKSRLWMGVQLNSLIDKTPSHMAEMLIQGSTMGIIKGVKNKHKHQQSDQQCCSLEDKFLSLQQEHIEDMKQFL